ncbi:Zinc finger MYM-type protein 1 [Trachymyrmex cornetzi]|uniref:Zinc finger MYM-type protein 1 n=1 Tax=Trachymyrmex cornetzi TaxID=471704 RepID=A0A151J812_9HYME|nr:Zinc finger MYM-type protein 1 [Trachymyrmex cornetzi]
MREKEIVQNICIPELSTINNDRCADADQILPSDPVEWPINDYTRDYVAMYGYKQNKNADFSKSKRQYTDKTRMLTKNIFNRKLANGELQPRSWLVYSESTGHIFCGTCRLFQTGAAQHLVLNTKGFNDWKNASECLKKHENSNNHKTCVVLGRVDKHLIQQLDEEMIYWRKVLHRVVVVIKTLASRGLSFRGHEEKFGSNKNGNYMMLLEVIAKYDSFLADHINKVGNPGRGHTSYLSSTICNEFIQIIAHKVVSKIIDEIRDAKYFSIIVDSTPDISHIDQLSFVVRYINKSGLPVERFIKFIPNTGHKAEDIFNVVITTLETYKLDINDCRGQSYDNASNMSGVYSGFQARIKNVNSLAKYVPCSAHSLNLIHLQKLLGSNSNCLKIKLLINLVSKLSLTLKRDRLNALSILCIESDILNSLDFDDIINDFAKKKIEAQSCLIYLMFHVL